MIEVNRITKKYGATVALMDVSLRAEPGSVLGLLGQNGAGKTTLLSIMTGFLAATEGRVTIDGLDPLLAPEQARRLLGYMPELPPLYDEMTVREYLRFAAELKRVAPQALTPHLDEVMQKTGVTAMRDRKLGNLSKGYRQRVNLAQALCGDPPVLLLDEPTSGLDPRQIIEIRGLIRQLARKHTIVFSSHILSEVQQLCDRVVILHQGRVRLDAPLRGMGDGDGVQLSVSVLAAQAQVEAALAQLPALRKAEVRQQADACVAQLTFQGEAQPEARVFDLFSGLGLTVVRLCRSQDTLEQVFLQATQND